MKKYNIAFFGTPYFAADFLEKVINDKNLPIKIKFVITQPNKPVGKKKILTPSPVKIMAQKYQIETIEDIKNIQNIVEKLHEIDFCLVFAYGFKQLIPKIILQSTKIKIGKTDSGFINIHPSLLPKYRGAAPIAFPLLLGVIKTGVSLFVMDEKMDHGPIIVQKEINISPHTNRPRLEIILTNLSYELFSNLVKNDLADIQLEKQNEDLSTHAHFLTKEHGFIPYPTLLKALKNTPLSYDELPNIIKDYYLKNNKLNSNFRFQIYNSSKIIYDCFRGLYPWPGIWTQIQPTRLNLERPKRLKITDIDLIDNALKINKVQLEGKNEVDFKTFTRAYPSILSTT